MESSHSIKKIVKMGHTFLVKGDETNYHGRPFWDVVELNQWEVETFKIVKKFCSSNYSFIDLGAWIGPITLFSSCIAKHVYAVEPDPAAIMKLKRNVALNEDLFDKITLFEGCISDSTGSEIISNSKEFGNSETSLLIQDTHHQHSVNSLTFSDFITHYAISDCNMIKMDVEGSEVLILPGMFEYLKQFIPTLLISFHKPFYGDRCDEVMEMMFGALSNIYSHLYLPDGQRLKSEKGISSPFFDLIATGRMW